MENWPSTLPLPLYSSVRTKKTRVLKNQFGDGYTQRAAFGINSVDVEFNLKWIMNTTDADIAESFLEEHLGGDAFLWSAPDQWGGLQIAVICESWSHEPVSTDLISFSANFIKVFDL